MQRSHLHARLKPHAPAGLPGLGAVTLMIVWAVHNGGYDADTWYWGALVELAILAATVLSLGRSGLRVRRGNMIAITLFGLYTAWSYLSIAWAQSPGDALQGSNKTLLFLLLFTSLVLVPWTPEAALLALLTFVIGVGVIGIVLLLRLAEGTVNGLVIEGRLAAPTGYFNASAALFTIGALTSTVLASRRELPGLVRGALVALGCCGLQLALIVQSRGWLFTLPLMALVTIILAPDRLRVAGTSMIPIVGALIPIRRLLDVYQSSHGGGLSHAAVRAGHAGLLICAAVLVIGTLAAWGDGLVRAPPLSRFARRAIGTAISVVAIAALGTSFIALTHGHPLRFVSRQWNGFSQPQMSTSKSSHFSDVGSGRYDFWRVSLDAVLAHPIGGLGQDNFADYYVLHRHTVEETSATHSLEMRLLAHTGFVGFALFLAFIVAALRLAIRARRQPDALTRGVAGAALMPLVVWLIYGSVDWFWEFPALSGPALGFMAIAGSLGASRRPNSDDGVEAAGATLDATRRQVPRWVAIPVGVVTLIAAVVVVGLPYLSVREVSLASNLRVTNPAAALHDLSIAADLNPLNSLPGRLAGTVALQDGRYALAQQRFTQSISRERGGWFSWLGAGLAASALGQRQRAHADFEQADRINNRQPADRQALARVYSRSPLTSAEAFKLLVIID